MHDGAVTQYDTAQVAGWRARELDVCYFGYLQGRGVVMLLGVVASKLVGFPPLDSARPLQTVLTNVTMEGLEVVVCGQCKMCLSCGQEEDEFLIVVNAIDGYRYNARDEASHQSHDEFDNLRVSVHERYAIATIQVALIPNDFGYLFSTTGHFLPSDGSCFLALCIQDPEGSGPRLCASAIAQYSADVVELGHFDVVVVRVVDVEGQVSRF